MCPVALGSSPRCQHGAVPRVSEGDDGARCPPGFAVCALLGAVATRERVGCKAVEETSVWTT